MNPALKQYVIEQRRCGSYTNRSGETVKFEEWKEVGLIDASGRSSALRQADARWPGTFHRAKLIVSSLGSKLTTGERNDIHAITNQTI